MIDETTTDLLSHANAYVEIILNAFNSHIDNKTRFSDDESIITRLRTVTLTQDIIQKSIGTVSADERRKISSALRCITRFIGKNYGDIKPTHNELTIKIFLALNSNTPEITKVEYDIYQYIYSVDSFPFLKINLITLEDGSLKIAPQELFGESLIDSSDEQ